MNDHLELKPVIMKIKVTLSNGSFHVCNTLGRENDKYIADDGRQIPIHKIIFINMIQVGDNDSDK